jgi:hypothetical protein
MKKTLVCLLLSLTLILSTTAAVFAVDDVGVEVVKNHKTVVIMRVDEVGL